MMNGKTLIRSANEMINQGARAVASGKALETSTLNILEELNINYEEQVRFTDTYYNENSKMDFYLPELEVAIECKFQKVSGTADQKFPKVVNDLRLFRDGNIHGKGLIVLAGSHYETRVGIQQYLNDQKSEYLDWCFLHELKGWLKEYE
jgi:hypothetical protein